MGLSCHLSEGFTDTCVTLNCQNGKVRTPHPTKLLLIETAVKLIDEHGPQGFTVEQLLDESKISKGSLYHHFTDFSDVLDQAQVMRYSRYVDSDGHALTQLLKSATSREDLLQKFDAIVRGVNSPERAQGRADRATMLGMTRYSQKFAEALAVEQQRLTDSFSDIAREMQERGWIKKEVDPELVALFVQAYSMGYILNDITEKPIDGARWAKFISDLLRQLL